jgi:alginate O-acetyltransferase complex protein AlgJ
MLDSKTKIGQTIVLALTVWLACAARGLPAEDAKTFQERCAALARDANQRGTIVVAGRDNWLFLAAELRHLGAGVFWGEKAASVSRAAKPENADPLPAILDFNEQLRKIGVTLILAPVPAKAIIYSDYVQDTSPDKSGVVPGTKPDTNAAPARLDASLQQFYALLKTNGVSVVDLTPIFLANRFHPDGALYCKQDTHWSGNGCVLAARALADAVRALPGYSNGPPQALTSEWRTIEISGDLREARPDPKPAKETLRIRRVVRADGKSIEPDPRSPVILLGDSHCLVFHAGEDMLAQDAGLAEQLALELGQAVDLAGVRGSGATPARVNLLRRAQKDPVYWQGKRVVIWCFAVSEFTESDGWRKVPLAPP